MGKNVQTELLPIIQHLEQMTRCLESTTRILRDIAARQWPEIPNGEGIAGEVLAGEVSAGILPEAGSITDPRD